MGCPACDAGKGCGAGIFGRLLRRQPVVVQLINQVDARQGQMVTIGIPENVFMRLLLALYLLPLITGLVGAATGHYLASSVSNSLGVADGFALIGGVSAGALALLLGRRSHPAIYRRLNLLLLRVVPTLPAGIECAPTPGSVQPCSTSSEITNQAYEVKKS